MDVRERKSPTSPALRPQTGDRLSQIVKLRNEGLLLREIAEREGVTKERIRQILAKAKELGVGPKPPKLVVTRRATIMLGMSLEMRPGIFHKLMGRLGVAPIASKKGRMYWNVADLLNIHFPKCVVCQSPVPLKRYTRSVTCSRNCSIARRYRHSSREKQRTSVQHGRGSPAPAQGR